MKLLNSLIPLLLALSTSLLSHASPVTIHSNAELLTASEAEYPVYTPPATPLPFITRNGTQLMEGSEPFRFISINIPNLQYLEDRSDTRDFPTPWEQMDALRSLAQMGARFTRSYTFAIVPLNSTSYIGYIARFPSADTPRPPGRWVLIDGTKDLYANERAYESMDWALAIASMVNIRLMIPFIDRWEWWGGVESFASLFGKPLDAFWTDTEVIYHFKMMITHTLERVNKVTGIKYKDDPAVAMWETGNELVTKDRKRVPPSWTIEICKHMKEVDPKHLTVDGSFALYGFEMDAVLSPYIDIFTGHYYDYEPAPTDPTVLPKPDPNNFTYAPRITADANFITSFNKSFFAAEAGVQTFDIIEKAVQVSISNPNCMGFMVWSLRYHSRFGGFYVHAETYPYFSYHHPGFPVGGPEFPADEVKMMDLLRRGAKAINSGTLLDGTPSALLPVSKNAMNSKFLTEAPAPAPQILSTSRMDKGLIWTGSTGATHYIIEKADDAEGPWRIVERNALDSQAYGNVLWTDPEGWRKEGAWYRMRGVNGYGESEVSKAVKVW
ncbi:hypothetical protein HDV05_002531 [Chytridiales sp. JEL 0842]|nr:hypothetical protein HDV05_002531 [Chytridiales sp. JEL 0842]